MGLTVNQSLQIRELSTAAKLHLWCDGLDHQFDVCIVLYWRQVKNKGSRADQGAEVVGWRSEEETLLVSCQNIWSHDEEHDGQTKQEAIESDLAEAAQGAPAPRRLPFHLQHCKQVHGCVIHLQKQGPLAVVVHRRAQQAIFVVHLCHVVGSLEFQVSQLRPGEASQSRSRPEKRVWDGGKACFWYPWWVVENSPHHPLTSAEWEEKEKDDLLRPFTPFIIACADAATCQPSEISQISLCYSFCFPEAPSVTLTSCWSADLHLCICIIWSLVCHQSQAVMEILSLLVSLYFFFLPQENVISSVSRSQWQNKAAV